MRQLLQAEKGSVEYRGCLGRTRARSTFKKFALAFLAGHGRFLRLRFFVERAFILILERAFLLLNARLFLF